MMPSTQDHAVRGQYRLRAATFTGARIRGARLDWSVARRAPAGTGLVLMDMIADDDPAVAAEADRLEPELAAGAPTGPRPRRNRGGVITFTHVWATVTAMPAPDSAARGTMLAGYIALPSYAAKTRPAW